MRGPIEWLRRWDRLDDHVHLGICPTKGCLSRRPPKLFRHLSPIPFLTLDHLLYLSVDVERIVAQVSKIAKLFFVNARQLDAR